MSKLRVQSLPRVVGVAQTVGFVDEGDQSGTITERVCESASLGDWRDGVLFAVDDQYWRGDGIDVGEH